MDLDLVGRAHQVVEDAAGHDDLRHRLRSLLHRGEDHTEPVGQNAKGVLHDSSGSGQAVVEDPFFHAHVPPRERLHHPGAECEGVIIDDKERHVFIVMW